jgi:Protein of unknown function (DUF998)
VAHSFTRSQSTPLRPSAAAISSANPGRILLAAGALAGPVYVGLGLGQALLRPGFDVTRHDLSLLSNGDFGWIQISNFLLRARHVIKASFQSNPRRGSRE